MKHDAPVEVIEKLEERLDKAKTALEYCALDAVETWKKAFVARQALAAVWPAPRVIEVGGVYFCKDGSVRECIHVIGDWAYLVRINSPGHVAYSWSIDGGTASLGDGYDIDWSRS